MWMSEFNWFDAVVNVGEGGCCEWLEWKDSSEALDARVRSSTSVMVSGSSRNVRLGLKGHDKLLQWLHVEVTKAKSIAFWRNACRRPVVTVGRSLKEGKSSCGRPQVIKLTVPENPGHTWRVHWTGSKDVSLIAHWTSPILLFQRSQMVKIVLSLNNTSSSYT